LEENPRGYKLTRGLMPSGIKAVFTDQDLEVVETA
jgi:hypothetical protein